MPPTLKVPDFFDPDMDAVALKEAMKGLGTDEETIISILSHRSNQQRQDIAAYYKQKYNKDLLECLKSETSFNFKETLKAMMTPIPEFIAKELHDAMSGLGTDEATLIEIFCSYSNSWIRRIRETYENKYHIPLEKAIKKETSGSFREILLALCRGQRDESSEVNMELVEADVDALIKAGVKKVHAEDSVFITVLVSRSYKHLRKVFKKYQVKSGTPFDEAIKAEFSGDFKDALMAIVQVMQNSYLFYAKRLHKAIAGLGTNDKTLIRIIVVGSEFDHLDGAKKAYQAKYGRSLVEDVVDDTSGDYRKMLLALIN